MLKNFFKLKAFSLIYKYIYALNYISELRAFLKKKKKEKLVIKIRRYIFAVHLARLENAFFFFYSCIIRYAIHIPYL